MHKVNKYLAIAVIALGIVVLAIGTAFIVEGQAKLNFMKEAMQEEQITLGLSEEEIANGNIVDTAAEAQKAGDTIREHRRNLASTYSELGRFDPENPTHVTYMQALNLENYLYMSVSAFGLITVVQIGGVAMIVTGLGLGVTGFLALRWRQASPPRV